MGSIQESSLWLRSRPADSKSHHHRVPLYRQPNGLHGLIAVKGPYADHILIPQGSTGSSIFFDIKWKPIFFLLQIQNFSFKFFVFLEILQKSVKLNGIPENNFLCIFIIASSPGVHTFFCLRRVNKKLPQGETSQNAFQRSRSINYEWKNMYVKMGTSTFNADAATREWLLSKFPKI